MGKDNHPRLFVGLPLPEVYQDMLTELRQTWDPRLASRLSWTKPGNWHLTLAFLGPIRAQKVDEVRTGLKGIDSLGFELQAQGAGAFPPRGRPRVLWVGLLRGAGPSLQLAQAIWKVLNRLGIKGPDREFRPHLTLARVRQERGDDWTGLFRALNRLKWPSCQVQEFVLWQSELTSQGPVYTALRRYPLVHGP